MKLDNEGIKNSKLWLDKGYKLPEYDRKKVIENTRREPYWVHFGAGNLFKAYHANIAQRLLNQGETDRGIIVAEGFDYELVEQMNELHDDLNILATLKSEGSVEKIVIGSICEAIPLDFSNYEYYERLRRIFMSDSLQFATFTITEKGYSLVDGKGNRLPEVAVDISNGPNMAISYMGKVAALLYARYEAGNKPIAMVSTDNCSHNGDKLYEAIDTFARSWAVGGKVEEGFVDYINDKNRVSFPWTMIDKITPRPDKAVKEILLKDGIEELDMVVTSKNTFVAPYVNAEETEYLVIEDNFPNGRIALEKAGVIFTDRQTVDKVERMKVCTCLNPLHTALAIFGCLLGYDKISEEMKDADIVRLIEILGYKEGLGVVVNPGIINPKDFLDTVIKRRLPNPFMPDTPLRIATDTSQKLAIRYGETIKAYKAADNLNVEDLRAIPLVLAGWLRYLMAVDDNGKAFELSSDPLLDTLREYVKNYKLKSGIKADKKIKELLKDENIFGVNLWEAGLAEKVIEYFEDMIAGEGAVRKTLQKLK